MNERLVDKLAQKEIRIGNEVVRIADILFLVCIAALSIVARVKMLSIQSGDYIGYILPWIEKIEEYGGFPSLKYEISDYTSPYMYILCFIANIAKDYNAAVKIASFVFDYLAAMLFFALVYNFTKSIKKSAIGSALFVFTPAVFINSAYWGQCDIIYTFFILYALYYFFKDSSEMCFFMLGIAFSFKLQSVFIIPFIIIMWLKQRTIKIQHVVWIPIVYVILQIPAAMFGRNLKDLMLIYFNQTDEYPYCTLNFPNIYSLLDEMIDSYHNMNQISEAGVFITLGLFCIIAYYIYSKRFKLDSMLELYIALFTVGIAVYFMPHMHDRYGILLDIISLLIMMVDIRRIKYFVGFSTITILTYMPYLTGVHIISQPVLALFLLGMLVLLGYELYNMIELNAYTEADEAENEKKLSLDEDAVGTVEACESCEEESCEAESCEEKSCEAESCENISYESNLIQACETNRSDVATEFGKYEGGND